MIIRVFSLICFSLPVWASPFGYNKYSLSANLESSYYLTTKNYSNEGNLVALTGDNRFTEIREKLSVSYDYAQWGSVYTSFSFKRNEAIAYPISRTNTGFSEFELGTDVLIWSGFVNIIPEINVTLPLHSPDTRSALLDDNTETASIRLNLSKSLDPFFLTGYGGYQFRAQGHSAQIPWGGALSFNLSNFFTELRGYGSLSLRNDKYTSESAVRRLITNSFNSGSLVYYSVNPTFVNGMFRIGVKFLQTAFVSLGVDQTVYGRNSASGTRFLLNIGFSQALGEDPDAAPSFEGVPEAEETEEQKNLRKFKVDIKSEEGSELETETKLGGKKNKIGRPPKGPLPLR